MNRKPYKSQVKDEIVKKAIEIAEKYLLVKNEQVSWATLDIIDQIWQSENIDLVKRRTAKWSLSRKYHLPSRDGTPFKMVRSKKKIDLNHNRQGTLLDMGHLTTVVFKHNNPNPNLTVNGDRSVVITGMMLRIDGFDISDRQRIESALIENTKLRSENKALRSQLEKVQPLISALKSLGAV